MANPLENMAAGAVGGFGKGLIAGIDEKRRISQEEAKWDSTFRRMEAEDVLGRANAAHAMGLITNDDLAQTYDWARKYSSPSYVQPAGSGSSLPSWHNELPAGSIEAEKARREQETFRQRRRTIAATRPPDKKKSKGPSPDEISAAVEFYKKHSARMEEEGYFDEGNYFSAKGFGSRQKDMYWLGSEHYRPPTGAERPAPASEKPARAGTDFSGVEPSGPAKAGEATDDDKLSQIKKLYPGEAGFIKSSYGQGHSPEEIWRYLDEKHGGG